ncbi:MAG TPA: heavy-metal-associated domain-containing protein [Casimicrobiaceae bacterium]|jgi:copper chaperone|nr:heavy-metal-associated domain-containing protein [Casimicrobiaceae bacterium]
MQTLEIAIDGMSCNGCVGSVTRVLKAVPGVADVTVTLQPPRARIAFDPVKAGRAQFAEALDDAGYGLAD